MAKAKSTKYSLPGQKKDTPAKADPLYRFYTSLLKQNKNSRMAMTWCLVHGVFSEKRASKVQLLLQMENLSIK